MALWYNHFTMLGLSFSTLLTRVITLVIALTVHEFSHAWVANELGDDTPRINGRLTLNPLAHLDVFGSLMLVLAGFGWAKPVPVNPYTLQRRTPAGMMLVSVAGPVSNLILAILAAIPVRMGLIGISANLNGLLPSLNQFFTEFIFINLLLLLFNIIPLFPLDGEKVLEYFLPQSGKEFLHRMRPISPFILMILMFIGPRFGLDIFRFLVVEPAMWLFSTLV
ncbi:MAG: site-2 protease family protein [Anaerolineales bacterium]